MRIVLLLTLIVAGWVFLVENDQELVNVTLPGVGRIGPFSLGIVILGSILFGIVFSALTGGIIRFLSRLRKSNSRGPVDPSSGPRSDPHDNH